MRRTIFVLALVLMMLVASGANKGKGRRRRKRPMARYFLQHAGTGGVSWASDDVLNPSTGAFTAMAWMKSTQDPITARFAEILYKKTSGGHTGWSLYFGNATGLVLFGTYELPTFDKVISTTAINDGEWHHIAGTRDSSNLLTIYVDGVVENTFQSSSVDVDTTENLVTSHESAAVEHSTGAVDDIRFYKGVAFAAYQIANIYNSGIGVRVKENGFEKVTSDGFYSGCNDGSGTTVSGRKLTSGVWSDHNGSFTSGDLTWVKGGVPLHSQQLTSDYEEYTFYINNTSKRIQFRFRGREDFAIREFKILQPQVLGDR